MPAHADWQGTHWGMTEEQVESAITGPNYQWRPECTTGKPHPDRFEIRLSNYTAGEFAFQGCIEGSTTFGLDRVGLSLKLADPGYALVQGDKLKSVLEGKYGASFSDVPARSGSPRVIEWHAGGDRIKLTYGVLAYGQWVSNVVMLDYTPLSSQSSKGL